MTRNDSTAGLVPVLIEAHNPGPMTGRGNNTYVVCGDDGRATLIDAGVGNERHLDALQALLDARGASLAQVIVTHGHPDHIGGAAALARRHPAIFWKYPPLPESDGVPWRALAADSVVRIGADTLEVLHTPGHAPDHVALWHAPTRAAWVGDLVIAGGSVMVNWSGGGRMAPYLASLQRLLDLDPLTLYPAHGPVMTAPAAALTAAMAHRLERERQVVAALTAGRATVPSITDSIYDGLDARLVPAARETIRAHLHKLQEEGRAIARGDLWTTSSTSST